MMSIRESEEIRSCPFHISGSPFIRLISIGYKELSPYKLYHAPRSHSETITMAVLEVALAPVFEF